MPPRFAIGWIGVTDLGTLGGAESGANDIDDLGRIVGWSRTRAGEMRAALFSGGAIMDIGAAVPGAESSVANGIANDLTIVGDAAVKTGGAPLDQAFVWKGGAATFLADDPLPGDAPSCQGRAGASAIANTGLIVGWTGLVPRPGVPADRCRPQVQATRWKGMAEPAFRLPLTGSRAHDVGDTNIIVGTEGAAPTQTFRYRAGVIDRVPPPATSGYPFEFGQPYGVNRHGAVAGGYWRLGDDGLEWHAFLWGGGAARTVDLGVLPSGRVSVARDVNDRLFVVGYGDVVMISPVPGPATYRHDAAFVYHGDFGLRVLPRLPSSFPSGACHAHAVNEWVSTTGLLQIAGSCRTHAGSWRAVRWDVMMVYR